MDNFSLPTIHDRADYSGAPTTAFCRRGADASRVKLEELARAGGSLTPHVLRESLSFMMLSRARKLMFKIIAANTA